MCFRHFFFLLFFSLSCTVQAQDNFIRAVGTHFYKGKDKTPYYFIGTNFWYAPILGSTGVGSNRKRLLTELDSLQAIGVNNLRILVGADAGSTNVTSVSPFLQTGIDTYNDTLLVGLDFLLVEMKKRNMVAVLYLTNAWDWSGGLGFYLRAIGYGDSPDAHGEGYKKYVQYVSNFNKDVRAQELYFNYVRFIVSRINSLTGMAYRDDPTIMAWQLCNEPRIFGLSNDEAAEKANEDGFIGWQRKATALIKSIDKNHLVSTGSEGIIGCDFNEELYEQEHNDPNIDYLTLHIWPYNWRWATKGNLFDALSHVYIKSQECIEKHLYVANKYDKPLVVEEFGYPRDNSFYQAGTPTQSRDAFYRFIFTQVSESCERNAALAGCNFWGWGGVGRPMGEQWKLGDDYLCDPPHEPQGWYSVYNTDSTTLRLIKTYNFSLLHSKGNEK